MLIYLENQTHYRIVAEIETCEDGKTVRQVLKNQWPISGRMMTRLKKENGVYLNGEWSPFHQPVRAGDRLVLEMEEEACEFEPEFVMFQVLYEDADVLVVNKPPGLVTHPTIRVREGTLANGIMVHMKQRKEIYKVRFVNRLDMDTSGVMIVAKNAFSHHILVTQMKRMEMTKVYRVFVRGRLERQQGSIDAPVYRPETIPEGEPPRRVVDERGKEARTHFWLEERFFRASLVRVVIETGRTHQIRVHMKHMGHPVIGDTFYEPDQPMLIPRQALHASAITFVQPRTGEEITVKAPFPEDLERLYNDLAKEE